MRLGTNRRAPFGASVAPRLRSLRASCTEPRVFLSVARAPPPNLLEAFHVPRTRPRSREPRIAEEGIRGGCGAGGGVGGGEGGGDRRTEPAGDGCG